MFLSPQKPYFTGFCGFLSWCFSWFDTRLTLFFYSQNFTAKALILASSFSIRELSAIWLYTCIVMLMFACPMMCCNTLMSIPFSAIRVQNVWRMVCAETGGNGSSGSWAFIALTMLVRILFTEFIKSGLLFLVMKTKFRNPSTSNSLRSLPSRALSYFCSVKALYTLSDIGIVRTPDFVFGVLTWSLRPSP